MKTDTPDVISGIQPNADLHIGTYLGAVSNWVSLQHAYSCVYLVADLHAMTTQDRRTRLNEDATWSMVFNLMACGIDLEKSMLLVQSLVPEHTFLFWILSCYSSNNDLEGMPQFKEHLKMARANPTEIVSAGLFTYPILQAADILAYKARYVPVGRDQEQHLELARSIARRFNRSHEANIFHEPQPLFTSTPRVMSFDNPGRKMGTVPGDAVGLFEPEGVIRAKVRKAVTDSGTLEDGELSPGVINLLEILRACGKRVMAHEIEKDCLAKGSRNYTSLKDATADTLVNLSTPLKARREEIARNREDVIAAVMANADRARQIVRKTLREVCGYVGLPVP